jgi:hypothetical protein
VREVRRAFIARGAGGTDKSPPRQRWGSRRPNFLSPRSGRHEEMLGMLELRVW